MPEVCDHDWIEDATSGSLMRTRFCMWCDARETRPLHFGPRRDPLEFDCPEGPMDCWTPIASHPGKAVG